MSQRMRRNVSPSTSKQGPLKAVKAFSLQSTSRSSTSSPTTRDLRNSDKLFARKSPDSRLSPDKSSGSPKEKSKSHLSPGCLSAWRATSADPVVPYLTGQWPKDISAYHHYQSGGVFMCDKSTQTVEELDASNVTQRKVTKGHRRSASFGHGDLSKEIIKQRLQKTKEGSRYSESSKQRLSPVPGNHWALSLTAPPTVFAQNKHLYLTVTTGFPRHNNMNRFQRNSVEGLNVEIEKLVLSKSIANTGHDDEDPDPSIKTQDIPDGHRAPVPEVMRLSSTRTVDTQTPSGQLEEPQITSCSSRPESLSPAVSISLRQSSDLLHPDNRSDSLESKSSKGDSECALDSPEPSKFASSPKPEKSCPFVRQPPDGCEKIKVIEETRRPSIKEPLLFCPLKPNQFVFKPSQGSAFCPLIKHYLSETEIQTYRPSSVPLSVSVPQSPSIESQ